MLCHVCVCVCVPACVRVCKRDCYSVEFNYLFLTFIHGCCIHVRINFYENVQLSERVCVKFSRIAIFPILWLTGQLRTKHKLLIYWAVQRSWFARVNTLCNLSRKTSREVAASLPGRFLSRRCFTVCITVEVPPRTAKQHKCQYCCNCKNYRGKGMEGGKKVSLRRFLADQKIASS